MNDRADHDHEDSSTEADESLMCHEDTEWKNSHVDRVRWKTQRGRIFAALASYRWVLDTTLLFVILALLVDRKFHGQPTRSHSYEFAGDLTGFAPTCESLCVAHANLHVCCPV
jgi:hypothetical protein